MDRVYFFQSTALGLVRRSHSEKMQTRTVALFGANSRVGPHILAALLASELPLRIILLLRPSSTPPPIPPLEAPKEVRTIVLPNEPTNADLEHALAGVDVLVSALDAALVDLHLRLADACVTTGVRRFIPADFGSVRSDDPYTLDLMQNFRNKTRVRWHCQRLAEDHPAFSWTSLVTGHFLDFGLETELLGLDIPGGKALLFDGGKDKWSATTRAQIGRAVVGVIVHEAKTANQMLLVQSVCTTQLEILDAVQSVTGKRLETKFVDSKAFLREQLVRWENGDDDGEEMAVALLGIQRSNWTGEATFANKLLGLEEEDLEMAVRQTLEKTR
jgi:hypothetical protein